ncbi:nucleotidyl transferase AbiEii/AbiGii toxin family protein [bacterium]
MMHKDKSEFLSMLERTSAQTGFSLALLEKDYYITILLSDINMLSDNLVFKGGTCLNKIYYSYYRLSEDMDFTMKLPQGKITRGIRKNSMKPMKEKIQSFVKKFGLSMDGTKRTGHNESTQYIYNIDYDSVVINQKQSIKLEIGLRCNPILTALKRKISHTFLHPFTREPLFETGHINCLSLKELVAEKLRAAAVRLTIAPRDFYDISYLMRTGFDFTDKEFISLFKKKLSEDGFDADLEKYRENLGRSQKEISGMEERLEAELLDVLSIEERKTFDLQKTLDMLNNVFGKICLLDKNNTFMCRI